MYSSISGRNFAIAFLIGHAAPSASPQIVVPGMIPMLLAFGERMRSSWIRPPPALMRFRVLYIHDVPSRHGVHWPQLSWAKKRAVLYRKSMMLVWSSTTVTAAVPRPRQPGLRR